HAASKSSTLGVMMMMTGTFLYFWYVEGYVDTELILAVVFIFITAPVAAHLLGRSAFHADVEPYQLTILNELKRDETGAPDRSEEHTSELQSRFDLVCRLLLEKKKILIIFKSQTT